MKPFTIYIAPLAFAYMLTACGTHSSEAPKDDATISDSLYKNVQTAPATFEQPSESIKLNGKIEPNESKEAKVYALVSGKIKTVQVEMGDYVKQGQVLAVLQSSEVAGITNDVSLAESSVDLARKNMETKKELFESNLATQQDYLSAQIDYKKAVSEQNRAKSVASITGGNSSSYTLTAPISGYVIEKNISNNSEVRQDNNTNLFTIADLSTVWIIANVYEADISSIRLGDEVRVTTLANPEKDYIGKIDKVYNVLDPANRTMKVRISMSNASNELKPEMFATIKVNTKPSASLLSIPASAIVMDNSKQYVVVKLASKLEIREIKVLRRIDDKAFISGLQAGDQVVTSSQVFIYDALNVQ
ncbi:membrane fusion protein, cobalt-zinc-cadmium efflux system [Chitinophaga sp. YR573]|uniref:efflux RND transporter periplasmic adaptor subunit n=1 Tax=Chitinophaga sp. YR573 TaxID=1881040 RepID=UPI0008D4B31E|nr:efflux RND transporter periplasmic adaptor subunit [Chitinophaga sp. YR573]SEW40771.1 membrane fusion protein, cobalt-zinc-cadmium efflux system [Chitinophaga sp. YR573]